MSDTAPAFDPSQPYTSADTPPPFDASKPFTVANPNPATPSLLQTLESYGKTAWGATKDAVSGGVQDIKNAYANSPMTGTTESGDIAPTLQALGGAGRIAAGLTGAAGAGAAAKQAVNNNLSISPDFMGDDSTTVHASNGDVTMSPQDKANGLKDLVGDTASLGASSLAPVGTSAALQGAGQLMAKSPTVQRLLDAGIQLTPGQLLNGKFLGAASGAEDAYSKIPIVGEVIQSGKDQALESFNRAMMNRAIEPAAHLIAPVGAGKKVGADLFNEAFNNYSDAYDKVLPNLTFDARLPGSNSGALDPTLVQDLYSHGADLDPDALAKYNNYLDNKVISRLQNNGGVLSGEDYKKLESELSKKSSYFTNSTGSDAELGDAIKNVKSSLFNRLLSSNPGHAEDLQDLNAAYSNLKTLANASKTATGDLGVFTPVQALKAIAKKTSTNQFVQGMGSMQDLASDAQRVLPSENALTGFATRNFWGHSLAAAGGGGFLGGVPGAVVGAASALPYTRPGMSLINRMARMPSPLTAAGEAIGSAPAQAASLIGSKVEQEHENGD